MPESKRPCGRCGGTKTEWVYCGHCNGTRCGRCKHTGKIYLTCSLCGGKG